MNNKILTTILVLFIGVILTIIFIPFFDTSNDAPSTEKPHEKEIEISQVQKENHSPPNLSSITFLVQDENQNHVILDSVSINSKELVFDSKTASQFNATFITQVNQSAIQLKTFEGVKFDYTLSHANVNINEDVVLIAPSVNNVTLTFQSFVEHTANLNYTYSFSGLKSIIPFSENLIYPNVQHFEKVLEINDTTENYSVKMPSNYLTLNASASNGIYFPNTYSSIITSSTQLAFIHNPGAKVYFPIRNYANNCNNPPASLTLIHQETNREFIGEFLPSGKYSFSSLPFGMFSFKHEEHEKFVPLNKFEQFSILDDQLELNVNDYLIEIPLLYIETVPLELTIGNSWDKAFIQLRHSDSDIARDSFTFEFLQAIRFPFIEHINGGERHFLNLIPGNYIVEVFHAYHENDPSIKILFNMQQNFSISCSGKGTQKELYFEERGNLHGMIDSNLYNFYSAFVYPAKQFSVSKTTEEYIKPSAMALVEGDEFIVNQLLPGTYISEIVDVKSNVSIVSQAFEIIPNLTTEVFIQSHQPEVRELSLEVKEKSGKPITGAQVFIEFSEYIAKTKLDENGVARFSVPSLNDLEAKVSLLPIDFISFPLNDYVESVNFAINNTVVFKQLTNFEFLLVDSMNKGVPGKPVFLSSANNNFQAICTTDETGLGRLNACPIGQSETKVIDNSEVVLLENFEIIPEEIPTFKLGSIKSISVLFKARDNSPISNVRFFNLKKGDIFLQQQDWKIDQLVDISKGFQLSDKDGYCSLNVGLSGVEETYFYYHSNFGIGFFNIDDSTPNEFSIELVRPAEITVDSGDIIKNGNYYLCLQPVLDNIIKPIRIKITDSDDFRFLLQSGSWYIDFLTSRQYFSINPEYFQSEINKYDIKEDARIMLKIDSLEPETELNQ